MPFTLPSIKKARLQAFEEAKKTFVPKEEPQKEVKVRLKSKSVLIYDYGMNVEFAIRLAKDFKKVYYYCHWETSLPKSNLALIGSGLEGVERVLDFWDYVDQVDLICCFDTYTDDIVEYLKRHNYRVWGAGKSELLENNRWKTRRIQKAVGLATQDTQRIIGIEPLIEYLKHNENKFVKINYFRGDIESFYHDTYDETQAQFLGKLMHDIGAKGNTMEFIVEDNVGEVEPGHDTWVIDGKIPKTGMYGYESKDQAYIGKVSEFSNLPKAIQEVTGKLLPIMEKLGGRTFFSTEVRVDKKKKGYLIDPTIRVPLPPNGIHLEMWKNISEVIWYGSEGKIIEPIPNAKYGAEILLHSNWAKENWLYLEFPKEIRQWLKLREAFMTKGGKVYCVPGSTGAGSVVGLGNTIEEAVEKAIKRVNLIKAKEIEFSPSALDDLIHKTIPKGEQLGIKF